METKKATPKKEETVTLLPTDKLFKDMSFEFMSFYKKQLNFAIELNESIAKSVSKEKMETPVYPTFLKMDGQQEAAEKLLKEISDAYSKQLDISIETNKGIFSEFNNQIKKVIIKTNEELLHLDEVA